MTYPEHDALAKISDRSQEIGLFIDWLSEQGLHLAMYAEVEDQYGDLENVLVSENWDITRRLGEYFHIDRDKLEQEKLDMLTIIRGEFTSGGPRDGGFTP